MTLPNLVVFYSPAPESGKSTASQFLIEHYGFALVKIAAPLKMMARSFLYDAGIPERRLDEFIEGTKKNDDLASYGLPGITPRKIMQSLGSEWGRDQMGRDVWANIAAGRARRLIESGQRVVIDDLRFSNEYDILHALGMAQAAQSLFACITRSCAKSNGHPSDGCLATSLFDVVLENNGSITELREAVMNAVSSV